MSVIERVFPNFAGQTHMPFFDGETLLFCASDRITNRIFTGVNNLSRRLSRNPRMREQFKRALPESRVSYRAWKLHYCPWNDRRPIRIHTGLPDDAVECSPFFYRNGGNVHVSFIGGVPTSRGVGFRLYTMEGPSLAKLSTPRPLGPAGIQFGFASERYLCWAAGGGLCVRERAGGQTRYLSHPFARLFRVSCLAEHPQILLITGAAFARERKTLIYDMESEQTAEVRASIPVYKCSVFRDQLIVAGPSGSGPEPYDLFETSYSLNRSNTEPCEVEQTTHNRLPVLLTASSNH